MANTFTDLQNNALLLRLRDISAKTATANGSAVDCVDSQTNYSSALLVVGAVSGTTPTLDVKIQESNDGSTGWTDCTTGSGAVASFTQVTAANTQQIISFKQQKRYARAVETITGTSPSFTCGVFFIAQDGTTGANPGGFTNTSGATVA